MFKFIEAIKAVWAILTSCEKLELGVSRLRFIYSSIQYIKRFVPGCKLFDGHYIEYGLFDYQSPYLAHYFIIVKDSSAVKENHTVSCIISSKLNFRGCKIKVKKWHARVDLEHVDEIPIKLNNEDPNKIIFYFELPSNQKYRIIIESDAEYIGMLSAPYNLNIKAENIKVKRSDSF